MDVRERLMVRLDQCRRNHDSVNGDAAQAGRLYIERRLAQLDAQFPRHGFGWRMPTIWMPGLLIVPAIRGWHGIRDALPPLQRRCRSQKLHKLEEVGRDLDGIAKLIQTEFRKSVPHALSPRLKAWGVILDALPRQPPTDGRSGKSSSHAWPAKGVSC